MNALRLLANKRPQLNAYQLSCGYLQIRRNERKHMRVTLWREHGCYHVRAAYEDHPDMGNQSRMVTTATTLGDAREVFRRFVEEWL